MLELKKIYKEYITGDFKQVALDKVNLNFRKNEFVSILGPSGSGKTTLLNIIGGLDNYTSGDLIINEVSTRYFKDNDWDIYRNHRVGFIFQNYNLIEHLTVYENVMLPLLLANFKNKHKRVLKMLDKTGLKDKKDSKICDLSGGQKQRVAISRALINNPDIILADEPTGALDYNTGKQILKLLQDTCRKENMTVIIITHNSAIAPMADKIIHFKNGKSEDIVINQDPTPIEEIEW